MKIVFFGTPFFAAEVLKYLLSHGVELALVVTQPDRPKGRSLRLTPSPVKEVAIQNSISVLQPEKASEESFLQSLAETQADLFVVVAFGQILSQKLLDIPPLGCINVHASLLPKYRGAAPIQRCLMAGESETGIAIQKMVRKLDAGDVIAVAKTGVPPNMTFGQLEAKLIELAQILLLEVIYEYEKGIPEGVPQDHNLATYASKIETAEGEIDWSKPALDIHHLICAFSPRPGAWVWVKIGDDKKRLKILSSEFISDLAGQALEDEIIPCGSGWLKLIEVQPEGKRVMKASEWLRGQKNISFIN